MKKLEPTHWYMEVSVFQHLTKSVSLTAIDKMKVNDFQIAKGHVEREGEDDMSAEMLQVIMRDAVSKMFGESAASLPIDVLAFHPHLHQAVVRVPSGNYSRVRGALTVCGGEGGMVFSIRRASPCLIALAGPQRTIA